MDNFYRETQESKNITTLSLSALRIGGADPCCKAKTALVGKGVSAINGLRVIVAGRVAMATKPTAARARRSKGQAQWLREQIEKEAPGWNPVLEMVKIARKQRLRKGDMDRLQVLEAVAKYVQPKLKMVEVEHAAAGGEGEVTIRWKG